MSAVSLAGTPWLMQADLQAIFAVLDGAAGRTRAVGGAVRDAVMGLPHQGDVDLATELTPDVVTARAGAAGMAVYPTGIAHGTVTVRHGEVVAEVTTLRRDVETDGRHAVVAFGTDWAEDASRRDFTLNALYCSADGALFDPLGGLEDALHRRVRFIGDAERRIAEDGLRVYRFFRFSASHGGQALDGEGLSACAAAVGRLEHLSRERVGGEMLRMLGLPAIAVTLQAMTDIGLLAAPETALAALQRYEAIGGRAAPTRLVLLGNDLDQLQADWRLANTVVAGARRIEGAMPLVGADRLGEAAYRFGDAAVEALAAVAAIEGWGAARLAEAARMLGAVVIRDFPISGRDLAGLGMAPGPALGQELARLEQEWIRSDFRLSRAELLALARL